MIRIEHTENDINRIDDGDYLRMEHKEDDIIYNLQMYDQYHPEYKRILEIFNFGI